MAPVNAIPPSSVYMRGRLPPHTAISPAPVKAPRLVSPIMIPIVCSLPVTEIRYGIFNSSGPLSKKLIQAP